MITIPATSCSIIKTPLKFIILVSLYRRSLGAVKIKNDQQEVRTCVSRRLFQSKFTTTAWRRILARLPHTFIEHQRRRWLRLLSTNNQSHPLHCLTFRTSSDINNLLAESIIGHSIRSSGYSFFQSKRKTVEVLNKCEWANASSQASCNADQILCHRRARRARLAKIR